MKFRDILTTLVLSSVALPCFQIAHAQQRIRLYTIAEYDTRGNEVPISKTNRQLLSYLENQLNLTFDIHRVPWKRAVENALNDGGMLMGMSITKERSKKFAFSEAINGNANWLVTLCSKSFKYEKITDLKGKVIGIVSSTSVGEEFDQAANQLFRVEHDTGAGIARLQKLAFKRVDALIWYGAIGNYRDVEDAINKNYDIKKSGADKQFCVIPKPVSIVTNHFAMRIDPERNQILNDISASLIKGRKEGILLTTTLPN